MILLSRGRPNPILLGDRIVKILFLQKRLLFPANSGGKIRSLNVLRYLAQWHDVTYVCNLLEKEKPFLSEMIEIGVNIKSTAWFEPPRRSLRFVASAIVNLFSSRPLNVDKDFDPKLRAIVESEVATGDYDLLVCDFVQMARNCIGMRLPKLLFQHNVEAEIFERLAIRSSGVFKRYLQMQAARMRKFEKAAGDDFDFVIAVSERDKIRFKKMYGWNHVGLIETAVDTNYFSPPASTVQRTGVVFVGSLDWDPNVDGLTHFIDSIWPIIRSKIRNAKLTIVGRNPPLRLTRHDKQNGIEITGTVDDVRPYLSSAAVSIVPLYSGGGTRLKIFEYMAMKCPVVSTSLGAEGLRVTDGVHLVIRDNDNDFASEVVDLLRNHDRCFELGNAAYNLVNDSFSAEPIARQFEEHCQRTIAHWKSDASNVSST